MPESSMDWWVIAGVIVASFAALVAFMRRPKKTSNTVKGGSGNTQMGGDGTTVNSVKDGDNNHQQG